MGKISVIVRLEVRPDKASRPHEFRGGLVVRPKRQPTSITPVTRALVVAGTGVDPVTPRFSGACSAD